MTNSIQLMIRDPSITKNISLTFPCNSEANASELPENLEEMFPWYDIRSGIECQNFQPHNNVLSVSKKFM